MPAPPPNLTDHELPQRDASRSRHHDDLVVRSRQQPDGPELSNSRRLDRSGEVAERRTLERSAAHVRLHGDEADMMALALIGGFEWQLREEGLGSQLTLDPVSVHH